MAQPPPVPIAPSRPVQFPVPIITFNCKLAKEDGSSISMSGKLPSFGIDDFLGREKRIMQFQSTDAVANVPVDVLVGYSSKDEVWLNSFSGDYVFNYEFNRDKQSKIEIMKTHPHLRQTIYASGPCYTVFGAN